MASNSFRRHLSMPSLVHVVRSHFNSIPDPVKGRQFTLTDCLMSGLAVFQLKFPSLLLFDRRMRGGAIDLVMHAEDCDFRQALARLQDIADCTAKPVTRDGWPQVRTWLCQTRKLDPPLVDAVFVWRPARHPLPICRSEREPAGLQKARS